ncbi:hypothetical protein E2320_000285, partial [Naja naja]
EALALLGEPEDELRDRCGERRGAGSTEALEFMKRDLTEFTQVVQHDTACTIAATASVVKEKLA